MTRACAENLPANHTYLFTYDWRLDPYKVADDIAATVDRAIAESGHDKVSIFCASMGGIMTVAYLTKYGYSKVDRCVFMSSTFCGAQVASDVLTGKIELKADTMYNYFSGLLADATGSNAAVAAFMKTLNSVGAFKLLQKVTDYIVDNYKDEVYERVLIPDFAYMRFFGDSFSRRITIMQSTSFSATARRSTRISRLRRAPAEDDVKPHRAY